MVLEAIKSLLIGESSGNCGNKIHTKYVSRNNNDILMDRLSESNTTSFFTLREV